MDDPYAEVNKVLHVVEQRDPETGEVYTPEITEKSRTAQEHLELRKLHREKQKLPIRAIKIKREEIKALARSGDKIEPRVFFNMMTDLWAEARLALNRAKRGELAGKVWNKKTRQYEATYKEDGRLVQLALTNARMTVNDLANLAKHIEDDRNGMPGWVIETIERALRPYPDAKAAVLADLARGPEKEAER